MRGDGWGPLIRMITLITGCLSEPGFGGFEGFLDR